MQKLNDEQKKMVEDHVYLVRYIVYRRLFFEVKPQDVEDYIQIGSIGLCNAALTFKPEYGFSFATYAFRVIRNEIVMEWRKSVTRRKAFNEISFDQSMTSDDDDPAPCDFITDIEDVESLMNLEHLKKMLNDAPAQEGRTIRKYISGYTQEEIGRSEGVSQSYSSRLIRRFRRRVEKEHIGIA